MKALDDSLKSSEPEEALMKLGTESGISPSKQGYKMTLTDFIFVCGLHFYLKGDQKSALRFFQTMETRLHLSSAFDPAIICNVYFLNKLRSNGNESRE